MSAYRDKILVLLQRMESLIGDIRHPNVPAVMRYLSVVRPLVERMTRPFHGNSDVFLLPRFQKHLDGEETRLRQGLETAKYDLDALDTIAFINGRRGLERVCSPPTLFPAILVLTLGHSIEPIPATLSAPHSPLQDNQDRAKIYSSFRRASER